MKTCLLRALLFSFFSGMLLGHDSAEKECDEVCSFQASLSHIESRGIGYHRGYTTIELFAMPRWNNCQPLYPFLDFRGHGFDNRKLAGNAGCGVRFYATSAAVLGLNVYYDICQGTHRDFDQVGHSFQQIGAGLEYLSSEFDVRLNFYQPIGEKKWRGKQSFFKESAPFTPINSFVRLTTGWHADGEIGRYFDEGTWDACPIEYCLYAALGTYFLDGRKKENIWGGKFRFNATFNRYYFAELRSTYDNTFNAIVQVHVGINIPLDILSDEKRGVLITPVERMEIIPLYKRKVSLL